MILEIKGLNKSFKNNHVIKNLDLSVEKNSVFGFVGPNGAGKTTTMKMILGFLKLDSGEIKIYDKKTEFGISNENIGYLPDVPSFYEYMKPLNYLTLCGKIAGVKDVNKRCIEVLELVGLTGVDRKIKGFSRGMRQRLGIAQALLNKPKLLICDEPTSALDPIGRREILNLLKKIKEETTIIFSTHILSDVEDICDSIGIISNGEIIVSGKIDELKKKFNDQKIYIEIEDKEKEDFVIKGLQKISGINSVIAKGDIIVDVLNMQDIELSILDFFVKNKIYIKKIVAREESLENYFMGVVK